jgi:hypothetical protein
MKILERTTNGNSAYGYKLKPCTWLHMETLYRTTNGNSAYGYTWKIHRGILHMTTRENPPHEIPTHVYTRENSVYVNYTRVNSA